MHRHHIPVCIGLTKVSLDCATATTFAVFTDELLDDFRERGPEKEKNKTNSP